MSLDKAAHHTVRVARRAGWPLVLSADRRQYRAAAERRFSLARMAADYRRLYRVILEHPGRSTPEQTGIAGL